MIDLRDFGLSGSPQSEECRLWACWLWVRKKVEEDYGFIYCPSLLILKVGSSRLIEL